MSGFLTVALAVMFLLKPDVRMEPSVAGGESGEAEPAKRGGGGAAQAESSGQTARITSVMSDFDRKEGVALFEGQVVLRYASDYILCADRLWAFMAGSNQISRVVATGHVSITNDTRVGTCEMAVYRRQRGEIEMFWDGAGAFAKLVENGDDASAVEGTRIKFWINAEQVEVDDSRISTQGERNGGKKFL